VYSSSESEERDRETVDYEEQDPDQYSSRLRKILSGICSLTENR